MTPLLLRLLSEQSEGFFEHKLCAKFGKEYGKFIELDQLIADGFAKRLSKERGFSVKGIYLTDSGRAELDRLNSIPPAPVQPSPAQIRLVELKSKLTDNSITFEETKELLKIFFRV